MHKAMRRHFSISELDVPCVKLDARMALMVIVPSRNMDHRVQKFETDLVGLGGLLGQTSYQESSFVRSLLMHK
jgi:hypothetical protein